MNSMNTKSIRERLMEMEVGDKIETMKLASSVRTIASGIEDKSFKTKTNSVTGKVTVERIK